MSGFISRRSLLAGAGATALLAPLAACSGPPSASGGALEFFQFKSEAIKLFDRICAEYNATGPKVQVQQNAQPDSETALRVRLVKGDMPALVTVNGNYNFGALARAGVFYDFSQSALITGVSPAIAAILPTLGRGGPGEVNAVPFANNGSGIIYNREIFEQHRLQPPSTWDELIAIADELQGKGVDPFYWGFKDNWTGAPMFSSLSGGFLNGQVAAWYEKRRLGQVSFGDLKPVFDKMRQLSRYGNGNKYEVGYNDGNQGFASGRSAMYVHGSYAIPAIRSYNDKIRLGTFATPADKAEDSRVVSGVDVALTFGKQPVDGAMEFYTYLMAEKNMAAYCAEQVAFPTLTGMEPDDEALEGLVPYFKAERLATYSDHAFPQGVNLNNYMQQFLINGDTDAFIRTLDAQWNKVIARINSTL